MITEDSQNIFIDKRPQACSKALPLIVARCCAPAVQLALRGQTANPALTQVHCIAEPALFQVHCSTVHLDHRRRDHPFILSLQKQSLPEALPHSTVCRDA
jgi:hypothetical protein